jgi:hypothetical protein
MSGNACKNGNPGGGSARFGKSPRRIILRRARCLRIRQWYRGKQRLRVWMRRKAEYMIHFGDFRNLSKIHYRNAICDAPYTERS